VVAYDISDDRTRNQIAKVLEGFGYRVQKSVFECLLTEKEYDMLKRRLNPFLKAPEDRIYFYTLCNACVKKIERLGKEGFLPSEEKVVVV